MSRFEMRMPDAIECEAERGGPATSELVKISGFTSGRVGAIPYVVYFGGDPSGLPIWIEVGWGMRRIVKACRGLLTPHLGRGEAATGNPMGKGAFRRRVRVEKNPTTIRSYRRRAARPAQVDRREE